MVGDRNDDIVLLQFKGIHVHNLFIINFYLFLLNLCPLFPYIYEYVSGIGISWFCGLGRKSAFLFSTHHGVGNTIVLIQKTYKE